MSTKPMIYGIAGMGFLVALGMLGWLDEGWRILAAFLALISSVPFMIGLATLVNRHIWVRVPEMETYVIFHRERKAFLRFLPPGRSWLQPWEYVYARISTAVHGVPLRVTDIHTEDGIDVTLNCAVTVVFEPDKIDPEMQARLARALPQNGDNIVRNHARNCVSHLVNEHTLPALLHNGARRRIERQLRDQIHQRLARFGIAVYRVMLKGIELPNGVREAHIDAHQRVLHADREAQALERLHLAIQRFSDVDKEWLVLLRQIYEMGRNGVALHMPLPTYTAYGNGRVQPPQSDEQPAAAGSESGNGKAASGLTLDQPPREDSGGYGNWQKN